MGLGAFNDNLFKSAIAIFITYNLPSEKADFLVQLSAGLFILPFFLISGVSGQVCDKYEKAKLMKLIKVLEIVIMFFGGIAFINKNVNLLLVTLFFMGAQSTLFGPVKYSILPQHLKGAMLLKGNAYTSMGTFIFILFGTILGGYLVSQNIVVNFEYYAIAISVILFAIGGFAFSIFIPMANAAKPNQIISFNFFRETINTIKLANFNSSTKESIYGISWFWFFGFFFMASLPIYCRDIIKGNEIIATIYLGVISIGMGFGSVIGEKITKGNLRPGIVGIAGLFLTIFAILFSTISKIQSDKVVDLSILIQKPEYLLSNFYLLSVGIFGGLLIVPLYTQLQLSTPDGDRSKFIACNNIMNALFMVLAAIFSMLLLKFNFEIQEIFLIVAMMNGLYFSAFIYRNPRDFYLSFFDLLIRSIYKVEIYGSENLQSDGAVVIAANHVSFIDPLILTVAVNRPPIFIMDQAYFDLKLLQWFYTSAKAIPITPKKICSEGLKLAMEASEYQLKQGEMVAIFPEGFITKDGNLLPFKDGITRLGRIVPELNLYPVAISGMWGSWFSRHKNGKAMNGFPKRRAFRTKIKVSVGKPIPGPEIIASNVQDIIEKLRGKDL